MDLIDRQDAINAMCDACSDWCDEGVCKKVSAIQKLPSAQPEITEDDVKEYCRKRCLIVVTSDFYNEMYRRWASAQPERKKGQWILVSDGYTDCVKCDKCGEVLDVEKNFCPNCGADMRGDSND